MSLGCWAGRWRWAWYGYRILLGVFFSRIWNESHPADRAFTGVIVFNRGVLRHRADKRLRSGFSHDHWCLGRLRARVVVVSRMLCMFLRWRAYLSRLEHLLNRLAELAFRIEQELTGSDDPLAFLYSA